MSQSERTYIMNLLCDKTPLVRDEVLKMSDEQVEYYHWLYFEESVYDYM
ncbi:hypothetical protein KO561_09830 [Radiobacillus kanasensis]|nr:hypothetical protein [Radiobacillus kanasensis]UFU01210.1 hypothetical protein KO561_09830 [Radiobacillus kanasensis]